MLQNVVGNRDAEDQLEDEAEGRRFVAARKVDVEEDEEDWPALPQLVKPTEERRLERRDGLILVATNNRYDAYRCALLRTAGWCDQ